MKIAMLTGYGATIQGGIETYLQNICREFARIPSLETHLIILGDENCEIDQDGVSIHFIKQTNIRTFKYHYYPYLIRKHLLKIDPDIVSINATNLAFNSIAALSLIKQYPMILTVHGLHSIDFDFMQSSLKRSLKKIIEVPLEKQLLKRVPHIIVPSISFMSLISGLSRSRIHIIPQGINLNEIQTTGMVKGHIQHPCILYMGRLAKEKGVEILIKAIPIIRKSIPDVHVYIAGSGQDEKRLIDLAGKLNLRDSVEFLGFLSGEKKWSYYKSSDVCIVPSIYESFGIALLEAMACGKPVVASNVGNVPEVVENGKNGLLFEYGNFNDLAEKTIFLLQNKEYREKLGENGRERSKEFQWDKIAERTVGIYEEVISEWNNEH